MRFRGRARPVSKRSALHGQTPNEHSDHVAGAIEDVVDLENRDIATATASDRGADHITLFAGSMLYVWLHVVWFAAWVIINLPFLGIEFDPFPFGFLTMIVSLEAIFLSTFVLISQNRQARVAERRSKVDLQVNAIAEREITKILEMVRDIKEHLPGLSTDDEAEQMLEKTSLAKLADAMDDGE